MMQRWIVLATGIFCILISTAIAQINIKERVEIKPTVSVQATTTDEKLPITPLLLFNGKNSAEYTMKYGESVELCISLAEVIGSSVKPTVNTQSSSPHLSVQTTAVAKCTVSVYNGWDACGVFVRSSGDTIKADTNGLSIAIDAGETFYYVANGTPPDDFEVGVQFLVECPYAWFSPNIRQIVIIYKALMLGETKYYYTTNDIYGNTLTIHSTSWLDDASSNRFADATFAALVAPGESEKNPCYWETKDPDGNNLPAGVLRVIGRYWEQGKTFKSVLTATATGYTSATDTIEVVRPSKLGTSHNTATNVFGNTIALDDTIIKYAGANGIPPQFIKGQIEQETNFKNAWRYEPMKDLEYQKSKINKKRFFPSNSPFVMSSSTPTGTGDWPNHSNVSPKAYNNEAVTIGKYFSDNWSAYRRRGKLGQPDSVLYSVDLSKRYKELYKPPLKLNKKNDGDAKREAYDELGKELKEAKSELGLTYNIIAQTRIVSSYGLIQFMYTSAIDVDGTYYYETDNRYAQTGSAYMDKLNSHQYPEKLNEMSTFMPIYCDRILRKLHKVFNAKIPDSQWSTKNGTNLGYEANWKASLIYYNPASNYSDSVMVKSTRYLPQ
jgi:hypothetical protein